MFKEMALWAFTLPPSRAQESAGSHVLSAALYAVVKSALTLVSLSCLWFLQPAAALRRAFVFSDCLSFGEQGVAK
jgi:hypothetical protein